MDDLAAIQAPDDSEIKVYIMKLFRNGFQLAASAANSSLASTSSINSSTLTMSASRASKQQRTSTGGAATTTSDQIMAVFRKINSADSSVSKEGVRELYDLKQQHPDIDIDKYCRGTSSRLKSYVDEQLRLIEQERSPPSSSSSSSGGGGGGGGASSSSSSSSALGLGGSSSTLLTTTTKPRIELDNNNKPVNRRADDIMKTIADWKSKTQLNKLDDDDDNDENNIRTAGAHHNSNNNNNGHSDLRIANSILTGSSFLTSGIGGTSTSTQRLFQAYQTNGGGGGSGAIGSSRLNLLNRPNTETSENSIKAERYLDIVKDLKKKYTRSRTEVSDFRRQLNNLYLYLCINVICVFVCSIFFLN